MTKTQLKLYLEFMLIKYNNDREELCDDSIKKGNYWCIKALLEDGYDIHEYCRWSLRWVCNYGYYRIAKLLIKHGADVDEALKWANIEPKEYKAIKWLERYKHEYTRKNIS